MTSERAGELKLLENMSRDFAVNELRAGREERDNYPFAPLDDKVLRKTEELGYFNLLLEDSAIGSNISDLGHVLKIISLEDASLAATIFAHSLAQMILIQAEQKDLLNKLASEDSSANNKKSFPLIAFPCFAFPEDTAPGLKAEKTKGKYRFTGKAEYVVLGSMAQWLLLPAKTEKGEGYSFFLCSTEGKGIETGPALLSLGLRSCSAVDLAFNNVEVTLIGNEGEGAAYYIRAVEFLAAPAASLSLGVMKGSFLKALEYAGQRIQGGREIINWSEVRMLLSNMVIQCRSGELMLKQALQECEAEAHGWEFSALTAALQIQEMSCNVASDGVQILGGNGYMKDYAQEKRFRDAHHLKALLGHHPMRKLQLLEFIEKNNIS